MAQPHDYGAITVTVHLTLLATRFWPRFGGPENAPRFPLQHVEEFAIAERSADGFGAAQLLDHLGIALLGQEIRKIGVALANRRERRDAVVPAAEVCAHAGPAPVARAIDEARANRVERHVAQRRGEMFFVHRHAAEAALPEVSGPLAACMNDARVAAVHRRQRTPQSVGVQRCQNQMDVVRHQAPPPDLHLGRAAGRRQQAAVKRIVIIAEEGSRSPVATLRHVVRKAGYNDAGDASHAA